MDSDAVASGIWHWLTPEAGAALLAAMTLGAMALAHFMLPIALGRALAPADARQAYRALVGLLNRTAVLVLAVGGLLAWGHADIVWFGTAALMLLYIDFVLRPAMDHFRDLWDGGDETAEMPYRRSHRRHFGVNFVVWLILLLVFVRLVATNPNWINIVTGVPEIVSQVLADVRPNGTRESPDGNAGRIPHPRRQAAGLGGAERPRDPEGLHSRLREPGEDG